MRAIGLIVVLVMAGCGADSEPECSPDTAVLESPDTVSRASGRFVLGDEPFTPVGYNAYWALEAARRGELERVERMFETLAARGVTVVRIWAFDGRPRTRIHNRDGSLDEAALVALDRVIEAARMRGLRILVTLSNNWSDYGGLDVYATWEGIDDREEALRSEQVQGHLAFYATALAARVNTVSGVAYREDPTIFGWDLINELRCEGCPPEVSTAFVTAIAGRLRQTDPNHLIGLGDEGFVGEHGIDADAIADSGAVDWVSVHVWPHHWRTLPNSDGDQVDVAIRAAADGRQWIRGRGRVAARHGLPLLVGEMGWHRDAGGDAHRELVLDAWIDQAHALGAATLVWGWGDEETPDDDGFTVREGDRAGHLFCE